MPFSSDILYQRFIATVNTFQGGYYPPASVFIKVANDISLDMWKHKTDEAENNQQNIDDLSPFLQTKNCIVTQSNNSYGTFIYPTDYGQYSSARIILYQGKTVGLEDCVTCGAKKNEDEIERYQMVQRYLDGIVEHDVKKIDNSKWGNCLSSVTKPPTLKEPKITQWINGFKVAPRMVSLIVLDYFTTPIPATYDYTTIPGDPQTGSGDLKIYNPNSVKFQWDESLIPEFINRLAEFYGLYTRDQFLTAVATPKVKERN